MQTQKQTLIPRTRRIAIALVAVACMFGSTPVQSQAASGAMMTGRALNLLCNSSKSDDLFSCQSYIAGVIDYHNLIKSLGTAPSVDFCMPPELKMDQIKLIVSRYISAHSEHQDFIAAPGVAMALFNAYPCKKRR